MGDRGRKGRPLGKQRSTDRVMHSFPAKEKLDEEEVDRWVLGRGKEEREETRAHAYWSICVSSRERGK